MTDFFIADLHISHSAILKFTTDGKLKKLLIKLAAKVGITIKPTMLRPFNTIEEHNEHIINSINSVVKKTDKLYILGDVVFGKVNFPLLDRINGIKYLIAGNHDCYATSEYLKYFNKIFGVLAYKNDCILSHVPVHTQQLENRFKYSIHGHLHAAKIHDYRYICVSCEQVNYIPQSYEQIMEKINKKKYFDVFLFKN